MTDLEAQGLEMYGWAKELYPICRSITGEGVRQTLDYLGKWLPGLQVFEVPTGTRVFDWTVPDEWNLRAAWLEDESGRHVVDFADHNLHVMGYSEPVDAWLDLEKLQGHLYSLEELPDAVPYVTSYYRRRWGFCLPHRLRTALQPGRYRAFVDSTLAPGALTYGELLLPGAGTREVLLSTYVCHPSMANNELSGPVVQTMLARWLLGQTDRRFTYRLVFVPETIGSIVYLSRNLAQMRERVVAGWVVTCVGDERAYSFLPSRRGDTLADRVTRHVLAHHAPAYRTYSFLQRGSDERQYCSPGVDLPVVSLMRSKYGEYPEYHTSLDDLSLITPAGLAGAYEGIRLCLETLERNHLYEARMPCEPQMGNRGLYPSVSTRDSARQVRDMMNVLAYADGRGDLIDLAETIGLPAWKCAELAECLFDAGLLDRVEAGSSRHHPPLTQR